MPYISLFYKEYWYYYIYLNKFLCIILMFCEIWRPQINVHTLEYVLFSLFFECLINISYFEIFMYMYVWILLLHECYSFVRLRLVSTKYSPKWLRRSALYLNAYHKKRERETSVTNKQKKNHIKQYSVITKFKKLFRKKNNLDHQRNVSTCLSVTVSDWLKNSNKRRNPREQ